MSQISFYDLEMQRKQAELIPSFKTGQDIFVCSLDVVKSGKVSHCFICGKNQPMPYYGYVVDFSDGLHTTTWDTEINSKTFYTFTQAQIKADEVSKQLTKLEPAELKFFDEVGFEYVRSSDNHLLTAGIAKVGETQLYMHKFMCYHFLQNFTDAKKRDKEYKKTLKDMERECETANGKHTNFEPEALYKCIKEIYASRGYAEHNGVYTEGREFFQDGQDAADDVQNIGIKQEQELLPTPSAQKPLVTDYYINEDTALHAKDANSYRGGIKVKVDNGIIDIKPRAEVQRLFVDMDGTLAVFTPVDKLETLYQKGYFANLKPIDNVVEAVKLIVRDHPELEVNILSAYLSDSPYALEEKNAWLDKNLSEIDSAHRIFLPCGQEKKDYIPDGLRTTDYLLDDYTKNLNEWEPPAKGIKLLNGINHTHGTWQKTCVSCDKKPQELAADIVNSMVCKAQVMDTAPRITIATPPTKEPPKTIAGQTTVEVLRQRGNVMMLQWHYPNGNNEYSVHNLDASQTAGISTGSYFDEDEEDACELRFRERSENITKAAEQDFSGFSYPYQKGKVLFHSPVGSEQPEPVVQQESPAPPKPEPKRLESITSFVREIRLLQPSMGLEQYFGYCNGTQETDGYDTVNDLIESNRHYHQADVATEGTPDFNVCSLYYSDGSVTRIRGSEHNVDFHKMPSATLTEFVDRYLKQNQRAANTQIKAPSQIAPHHQTKSRVSDQQIEIAKNTNLVEFLRTRRGYDLTTGSGGWHRWKEHSSFSVNEDGRWAWHSQNLKGGPIDFLMKCENRSFVEAVEELSGSVGTYVPNLATQRKEQAEQPKPPMKLPPADEKGARAKAYLTKTRGLDPQIVKELMADKFIYETADYHNVVFVGYDKNGTPKYAAQRGTLTAAEKPFKRDVLNSDKSYAFQLRGTSAAKVAVFEAPIDAISHKCIQKIFGQDYNAMNRIALGGVSDKALERYLKDNPLITQITFATDNDAAGHDAATSLMQKYKALGYTVSRMTPRAKDFNEDLLNIRGEFAQQRAAQNAQQQEQETDEAEADMAMGLELR